MTKQLLACPLCGHPRADINRIPGRDDPLLGCWACTANGLSGGDWLRAVAEEVGAPGGGALKDDPERWLAPYINGTSRRGQPDELPTLAKLIGWNRALLSNRKALGRLRNHYGVRATSIKRYTLGYAAHGCSYGAYRDYPAFTLPVWNVKGDLVNLRKRFWPQLPRGEDGKPIKYVGLGDRGVQLYPDLAVGEDSFDAILVAGEFDAIVGRRRLGISTVTTTCGAFLPVELAREMVHEFQTPYPGAEVAVMFDVGEERAAERAVEVLLAAGASEAWVVRLPMKREGADLSTWCSTGGTRAALLELIKQARK